MIPSSSLLVDGVCSGLCPITSLVGDIAVIVTEPFGSDFNIFSNCVFVNPVTSLSLTDNSKSLTL